MKHPWIIIVGSLMALGGFLLVWTQAGMAYGDQRSQVDLAGLHSPFYDKPVHNWRVCADLGVGTVPGLGLRRQRFRLCHSQGWRVLTYCLQPARPAPRLGTICSRTSEDTYWCGSGLQNLREYRQEETPPPTPTASPPPTGTPAPPTPTPTPGPPRQARPGGPGFAQWLPLTVYNAISASWQRISQGFSAAVQPTPIATSDPTEQGYLFGGIDFNDRSKRIRITIFPPDKRVNKGKPITISFIPGKRCQYSDHRGCVTAYLDEGGNPVTFVSVHSGVGGEGQGFRHALEGTRLGGAGYRLDKVVANLEALQGAEVVIVQGKKRVEGFTLGGVSRIPPKWVNDYLEQPMSAALPFAATLDPDLVIDANHPVLIIETCGWRVSGERGPARVPITSASIYLGAIQLKP